jgi:hypothetical protein
MKRNGEVRGLVVLFRLQLLSRRQRWQFLFLSNQLGRAEVLQNKAAVGGWGASFLRKGKRHRGVNEVHFIGVQTGVETKMPQPTFNLAQNQNLNGFPIEIQFFIAGG